MIRQHTQNLIILGTRLWSQEVDEASSDPVVGENLAYTLHFYAATHMQTLRDKAARAMANGAALFVTEWGTCEADGNGKLNVAETQRWLAFLEQHNISDANWAVADKDEACAALRPGAAAGRWSQRQLTSSGSFVRASLRGEGEVGPPSPAPTPSPSGLDSCASSGDDCSAAKCCRDPGMNCYRKDQYWASCKRSCKKGLDPNDPLEYRTPWSCELLSADADWLFQTTSATTASPVGEDSGAAAIWQQCGGDGWSGPLTCQPGLVCKPKNQWYSQCLPDGGD